MVGWVFHRLGIWNGMGFILNRVQLETRSANLPKPLGGRRSDPKSTGLELDAVKETALTEKGDVVSGRGDTPNRHDILTGSQPDGTAFTVAEDRTCGNWTRSGAEGAAMVGHHDRRGLSEDPPAKSWNSSHLTRGGCSQEALRGTGGAGLLYCFAAD
jgi:hypothetical protein